MHRIVHRLSGCKNVVVQNVGFWLDSLAMGTGNPS